MGFFVKILTFLSIFSMSFVSSSVANAANSDTLVVFFSATGNTRAMATTVSEVLGADKFELVSAVPYTKEDLDYRNDDCRANTEQRDRALRPEIKNLNIDLKSYKTIFLAYPLWWAEEPRIIDTFIESFDFSGKTVIPLCTSGGNDIQKSVENIRNLIKGTPIVKDGKRFAGDVSAETFRSWYDSI